jgi:hypothetical protein
MRNSTQGAVERYIAGRVTPSDQVQYTVDQIQRNTQQPVVVVVKEAPAERIDQSGLIFVLFVCLVGVALIAMFIVACHETPQVHQTVNIPNCHFLC